MINRNFFCVLPTTLYNTIICAKIKLIFGNKYSNQTVKVKGDRDIQALSRILNAIDFEIKIRLDFNSCLTNEEFETFLSLISLATKNKIEYISLRSFITKSDI